MTKENTIDMKRQGSAFMCEDKGISTTCENYKIRKYSNVRKCVKPNTWLAFTSAEDVDHLDAICEYGGAHGDNHLGNLSQKSILPNGFYLYLCANC